ncbi:MAG TPA: ORF6N domain-containing protein [Pseudobacteroides sp.]|uniref:ORF6N domain-containing protein n=1 Tax=Pseudobacteroides sp. TaxID=1968840 RepID=UPI002F948972
MTQLMKINSSEIAIKEYQGQRVVTFKEIDIVHQKKDSQSRKAFHRNKKHFVVNEDYFVLNKDEAGKQGFLAPNGLILLTESGYLMLAKTFEDELAWKIQKLLVNNYFRAPIAPLSPMKPRSNNEVIGYYKPITVKPELYQRVKELAASKGMNLNEVVEYMLSTPTSIVPRPSNEVKINYQIATLEALQNQKDITVSEVCEIARTIATLVSVNSELSGK